MVHTRSIIMNHIRFFVLLQFPCKLKNMPTACVKVLFLVTRGVGGREGEREGGRERESGSEGMFI